jgi:hypothetical protein
VAILIFSWVFAAGAEKISPWHFEFGVSTGEPVPLTLLGGIRYEIFYLRAEGLMYYEKQDTYWCGGRSSFGVDFFTHQSWGVEIGLSGGYAYATAPNGMHRAINEANDAYYLYNNDWEEIADISAEIGVRWFGFHTRLEVPYYYITGTKKPLFLWRLGYIMIF